MGKIFKEKKSYYIFLTVLLLVCSFFLFFIISNADTDSNKVAIKNIRLTKIDTGSKEFSDDGFDYNDASSYQKISGYIAGNDSNKDNRIVRSFDTLTYYFDFTITGKNDENDYEERKVDIKVTLPDEIAKYVSFNPDTVAGSNSQVFTFDGIDTYGTFKREITLYVLGAPNGTLIDPKFEIQESTNTDSNYVVTLGSTDFSSNTNNYEYDKNSTNNYSTTSSVNGFTNYMPTIVSSKKANINFKLLPQQNEGQKATYNNKLGRYLTYVLGIEMVGNETTGIKGYTMPNKDDITFKINATQNNGAVPTIENDWVRNYGNTSINGIDPVVVSIPYGSTVIDASRRTKFPGTISFSSGNASVSDYDITYSQVEVNADDSRISKSEYYIGSYAITVFSPRSTSDGKNDITTTLNVSDIAIKDTSSSNITVSNASASAVNKYYESSDYSLVSEIQDLASNKITSISKGTTVKYKTTFKYKKSLSNQGLKEIIKVDTNAYRVVPISEGNDINIIVNGTNLSKDDFEVKYLSGNYSSSNYEANTSFDRISSENLSLVQSSCSTSISNYSQDQIMNLYGGPCIKAKANTELSFDRIMEAKTDNDKEVPISKVIIQTKENVVLPDDAEVIIEVGIRVRNVSDLTQGYQITTVASSSDHDSELTYYSPRITNDENSITNPNNYRKTTYKGNNVNSEDTDSPWGATIRIVNFTSRQTITVTNKNTDGTMKTSYNVNKGETITYNIKTQIEDQNQTVGADDVWYINNLRVRVTLPSTLTYVEDKELGTPEVIYETNGNTTLIYTLPFTKPNIKIEDIKFKAVIKSNLKGSAVPIVVSSIAEAININGEVDASTYGEMTATLTIYATGLENVIVSLKNADGISVVEKDTEFSYLLSAFNNTNANITDYSIVDILPSNNDENGSSFSGTYKVKVTLPSSQGSAKLYCSVQERNKLANEVNNTANEFNECDITEGFVDATAIKITNISINSNESMEDIRVTLKPVGNNYEDKYINSFVGASRTYSQNESNKITVRVVSRSISGRVYSDINENGVKDISDDYIENIPITLYKLDSLNNETKIEDTVTDSEGYYKFKNLDVGRYVVKGSYDKNKYDLTLRYGIEDKSVDSDAYKIEEGKFAISNTKDGVMNNTTDGIRLTREIESIKDLDIGLIQRKTFGFDVNKFITKVDLTYNNATETIDYKNEKLVKLDIRNSLNAYVKVYYGIQITNNSSTAGYVKLINESIPTGATFDANDEINKGWFYTNGELQNISLEDDLIAPGEVRNLQIALNIPPQTEYRSYINTVTLLNIAQYEPEVLSQDTNADSNLYHLGEEVTYAGVDWHVINVAGNNEEQILTLLADSSSSNRKMGHTSNVSDTYKWSESLINKYINNDYVSTNTLNTPILYDNSICDDASGLPVASYGGTLRSEGTCQSNIYNSYKVRLLTETEYNRLVNSNLEDLSWLYGNGDFWLQNSTYVDQTKDIYGRISDATIVKNLAKYVNKSSTSIKDGYSTNVSSWIHSTSSKEVRPVITISNKNIIAE